MIEILLGAFAVILFIVAGWIGHIERLALASQMASEGEIMKDNLDHIAGALISLSELLEDAEGVIEEVQKIPTVGEILMQVGTQMLMNKIAPTIEPFADPQAVISQLLPADETHAETPSKENDQT